MGRSRNPRPAVFPTNVVVRELSGSVSVRVVMVVMVKVKLVHYQTYETVIQNRRRTKRKLSSMSGEQQARIGTTQYSVERNKGSPPDCRHRGVSNSFPSYRARYDTALSEANPTIPCVSCPNTVRDWSRALVKGCEGFRYLRLITDRVWGTGTLYLPRPLHSLVALGD